MKYPKNDLSLWQDLKDDYNGNKANRKEHKTETQQISRPPQPRLAATALPHNVFSAELRHCRNPDTHAYRRPHRTAR